MTSLIPYRFNPIARPSAFFGDDWVRNLFWGNDAPTFRVDIRDEGAYYLMEAELPGLTRDQVHVDVEGDLLTIRCDNTAQYDGEHAKYLINERRFCEMSRSFTLNQVKCEEITAEYREGVLRLKLPKKQENPRDSRRIDVQ